MTPLVSLLSRWLLRAVLLLAGLVFFVCLLTVAALLLALWLPQALWARVTGRSVAPWAFRVDPRARWGRFNQSGQSGQGTQTNEAAPAYSRDSGKPGRQNDVSDVIDVIPREIKTVGTPPDRVA